MKYQAEAEFTQLKQKLITSTNWSVLINKFSGDLSEIVKSLEHTIWMKRLMEFCTVWRKGPVRCSSNCLQLTSYGENWCRIFTDMHSNRTRGIVHVVSQRRDRSNEEKILPSEDDNMSKLPKGMVESSSLDIFRTLLPRPCATWSQLWSWPWSELEKKSMYWKTKRIAVVIQAFYWFQAYTLCKFMEPICKAK